ncbi:uncharacterized protein LOC119649767 [Hermetia illucens]|nr:uncharacterized protein LOC119649767 [Hermetia illucens]
MKELPNSTKMKFVILSLALIAAASANPIGPLVAAPGGVLATPAIGATLAPALSARIATPLGATIGAPLLSAPVVRTSIVTPIAAASIAPALAPLSAGIAPIGLRSGLLGQNIIAAPGLAPLPLGLNGLGAPLLLKKRA